MTSAVWATADLPGTGGVLRAADEDFRVEEIPAYTASGSGPHVLAVIEKRGLTTLDVVRKLASALGIRPEDVGSAGLKDRHAITRQQLSFPPPLTPEQVRGLAVEGVTILSAERHGNKLKTGHLRGNRFVLVIRGLDVPADEAVARAGAVLAVLARPPGMPNLYGEQRFAPGNVERGRAAVKGDRIEAPPRERRMLISAFQSELYNRWLIERWRDGLAARVIPGDLLMKTASGAVFASTDPDADQPRLDAGEVIPSGPMFGHDMRAPAAGTEAAAREQRILDAEGLSVMDFRRVGKLAEGTRRAAAVVLGDASVRAVFDLGGDPAGGGIEVGFTLPAGAYATVATREIMKG